VPLFLFILPLLFANQSGPPPDLTAEVRVYETTTTHNSFPDYCDQRLQQLYIAEDLDMAIEVQFSRALTDEESLLVQWEVDTGDAQPVTGDFEPLKAGWSASRPQPTERLNEYWTTVPWNEQIRDKESPGTRIGRYDTESFKFRALLSIPDLQFENGAMWVDKDRHEVLIALNEDVVVVPLPRE